MDIVVASEACVERECACACARGVCLFGSVCVSVYVCVRCSDLSRNKFTKISVEAAPLLVTLYHPNLQDAHGLVCPTCMRACVLLLAPRTCLRSTFNDTQKG